MSASSRLILFAAAASLVANAAAQDEEAPDLGFLEYLGSWQESDEEWLLIAAMEADLETEEESAQSDENIEEADESDED